MTPCFRRMPHVARRGALHQGICTMHPALSVIFFTTLSGAGYGLLAWLGVSIAMLNLRGQMLPALTGVQLAALAAGPAAVDDRPAVLARPSRQAAARLARVLAMAHLVAVARRRDVDRDLLPAFAIGALLLWNTARPDHRAAAGRARHAAGAVRAGDGGLHGDDLRLAQADPGLAPSAGGAGVPAVRAADRTGAAVRADAGDARQPGPGHDAGDAWPSSRCCWSR